jgi:predicted nucleic-acid-binding protein
MIGLDTNIIVRYLAQDDAKQSLIASRLIESLTPENPGFMPSVVLAEIVWVMEELYDASRDKVGAIVEGLLQTQTLVVQDTDLAWKALARYRRGNADFADYLIERTCAAVGCDKTCTFDKKAARRNDCGMTLMS